MNNLQIVIIISLLATAGLAWILSFMLPDMMSLMTSYNPLLISLFTASWTAGMAAMMFPAIVPMVIFYNKMITNKQLGSSTVIAERQLTRTLKIILFITMYLVIWALTGLGLLLGWSLPMNEFIKMLESGQVGILFGIILIVSGVYQFTSLKTKCIGYCESPLSFFMRRWKNGTIGAVKMGTYHGLYCLGCCWPYFLIMVALGWMNLAWMGLFAIIIFGEKMWIRGIWIARIVGIALIMLGIASSLGLITIYDSMMDMNNKDMQMNGGDGMVMQQDKKAGSEAVDEDKATMDKEHNMSQGMGM